MRVFIIAWKDLRQVLREWRSVLALVVMPLLFTAFMGFAFRPAAPARDGALPVGVVLEEEGWLPTRFERALQDSQVITPMRMPSVEDASRWIAEGRLVAAVVVPIGFSTRLAAREAPQLTLLADPVTWPGQLAKQAIERVVLRLAGSTEAAHLTLQAVTDRAPWGDAAKRAELWSRATARGFDGWNDISAALEIERPPSEANDALAQASPGMIVMFAILGLIRSAMVLVLERREGTLDRLLTTTTSRVSLIGGHLLGLFSVVFAQGLILVLAGQLAFGLDYLRAPLATLSMLAALSLWVTSLALFIGAVAKGPEQVVLFGFVATIVFCALGGTWFPLETTGGAFAAIGELTPAAWAMKGFHAILGGRTLAAPVLESSLALLGYAALFFVPAAMKTTSAA